MELLCTEYKGLSRKQELEIFQRVQLGKPLSQAEAFRATEGDWQDLARFYEEEFSDVVNCKLIICAQSFVLTVQSGHNKKGFWLQGSLAMFYADLSM